MSVQNMIHEKILHDISAGIIYIKGGKINYVNPAAENILAKTYKEMIDQSFAKVFIDYEENDDFNQIVLDAIYDSFNTHESIVQYFDGENIKNLHLKTSFLREGLQKIGILVLIDDVTELMKLRGVELDFQKVREINEQLEIRNAQLKHESETDKLTGLLNKKAMENLCVEYLRELEGRAALYVIDLDHFKEANDTYGHQTGDIILKTFADSISKIFEDIGYVGRFGGDEFVILLQDPPDENFIEEKARTILKAATDIKIAGMELQITASIGVADITEAIDYETAFALADKGVYFVKERGRANFKVNQAAAD